MIVSAQIGPHPSRSTTEHRQVDQHNVIAAVGVNTATTTGAHRPRIALSDRDSHPPRPVSDSVDAHVGQADKQFAHARRISFNRGSLVRIAEALCRARDAQPELTHRQIWERRFQRLKRRFEINLRHSPIGSPAKMDGFRSGNESRFRNLWALRSRQVYRTREWLANRLDT